MDPLVIVGGGMAAAGLVLSYRQIDPSRPIVVVGDEAHLPYSRPPLCKEFLTGTAGVESLSLRQRAFYDQRNVELRLADRAVSVHLERRVVTLASGSRLRFGDLVLATGASNRRIPGFESALDLRTVDDAMRLRAQLSAGTRVVIVGGGLIGLEVASSAIGMGAGVAVLEADQRLMSRSASEALSSYLLDRSTRAGVDVYLGVGAERCDARGLRLRTGELVRGDVVVLAIGVVPNVELAVAAGLDVDDGIVVDEFLRTKAPGVFAIGDCARYPVLGSGGSRRRLESVNNATEQARQLAATLTGNPRPFDHVPTFWSHQFGDRIQIAGVAPLGSRAVIRGELTDGSFSIFRFDSARLVAVESVNAPSDHVAAKRLMASGLADRMTPAVVVDPRISLPDLVAHWRSSPLSGLDRQGVLT